MRQRRCVCGHAISFHLHLPNTSACLADRCMNVCQAFRDADVLPRPGEPIVFGVHRLAPEPAHPEDPSHVS